MLQSHRSLFRSSLSWRNLAKGEMAEMIKSAVVLIKMMVVVVVINMIVVVVVINMMVLLIKITVLVTNLSREEMAEGREDKRLCWMLNTCKFEFEETHSTNEKLIFGSCKDSLKILLKMRSQERAKS